jgi:eukaryotic-like serine/threonine-protein kinase
VPGRPPAVQGRTSDYGGAGHLLDAPPPLPDHVPAVVAALVAWAMAKEPKRRPADAAMLAHHLLALRGGLEAGNLDAA